LIYGQSISKQIWSDTIKKYLLARYPNADLIIQNRAIGGFASATLQYPVDFDVVPFYPDLVIFHVYLNSIDSYESIINKIRKNTTAEVAMQMDHVQNSPFPQVWYDTANYVFLPPIAKKYACDLMDIRTPWFKYLADNKYAPSVLLQDNVHLNVQGNYLLATLIKRHLAYKPKFPSDPNGLVKDYVVGKDVSFVNGKLTLPFSGNRVDLIASNPSNGSASASVLIDAKKPSQFPGCYMFNRPNDIPGKDWPWTTGGITKFTPGATKLAED
jgi:hypothetical protein